MYSMNSTANRINLVLSGFIKQEEMQKCTREIEQLIDGLGGKPFTMKVDMRELKPLPPESQAALQEGQIYCREHGMGKSAVIVSNATIQMQFKRLGKESGIDKGEDYFLDDVAAENYLKS